MPERRRYPSDLSDARWELVEPVLNAWRAERRGRGLDIGRPPDHDLRSLLDAVLYVNRTGIPWRYLPHDYPHWNTVYAYFARWQEEGVFDQLNSILRRQVRRKEGREDEPSACVIDSQSIKTSTNVPAAGQGIDAGKKIVGRKRSIVIDTVGLLLGVMVTAASVQDSIAGRTLIDRIASEHPTVRKTWVDGGYRQHLVEHAATLGIDMHIVRRDPTTRGFTVL
ncbi:IS5 family transposase, partial [Streptomyces camponoticapitis]|uniref:IS5 family transposase n=1 Tax=Streptomyces camponoticapitis TaxID=1616125 RepID=UPI001665AB70